LLIQVIHTVGAGVAMFNAIKEGITQANDMNISFDNETIKKLYEKDFETTIVDKTTLIKTLQEHGMPHIYEQGENVFAEIDDLKLQFKKQENSAYLLNISCTSENKIKGSFEKALDTPAPKSLTLKVGALVIFNKNNPPYYINGSMGEIIDLQKEYLKVRLLQNNKVITVSKEIWQSFSYEYDAKTDTVNEKETGSFEQFPIQLGYALTIHKAQGKTLDKVIIDTNRGAFAHGQMYVALSRTRKFKDIHLTQKIRPQDIILDTRVLDFLEQMHKIASKSEG
jgi:hypothetical protein